MRSTVAAGAHTPLEKTLRPFFSCTTQCSPAPFTRRVRAASPGGTRTQPSGTDRTRPSAVRTVFGVGPGVQAWSLMLRQLPCLLGFFPGQRNENIRTARCGRNLGGPFLARRCKAQRARRRTEFVKAQVLIAFPFPLRQREVDGLGLLGGVDGTAALVEHLVFGTEGPGAVRTVDHREFLGVLVL